MKQSYIFSPNKTVPILDVNNKKSFIVDRLTKGGKIDNPEIIFVTPQNDNQSNLTFEGTPEHSLNINNFSLCNEEETK